MNSVRTTLFTGALALTTLVIGVICLPALLLPNGAARAAVKLWAKMALFLLRVICGVDYRIEGAEHIPTGGALVAANHQSMWETIAFIALLEKPVVAFKRELARVPIYGWWAVRVGHIPVDRGAGVKALRALTKAAQTKIAEGCQVVLFPEGTRLPPGGEARLQPGVASIYLATGVACTPAVHDSGRFWLFPGGMTSLKAPGTVTVRFMPPIEPGLDRKTFMNELTARLKEPPMPAVREVAQA